MNAPETTNASALARGPESLAALCTLWQAEGREIWITLQGGSMSPTILPGTRVRLHCHQQTPALGDIVACRSGGLLVIHRLIKIAGPPDDPQLICLGDGNILPDSPVPLTSLVGTVTAVSPMPRLRRVLFALRHPRRHTRFLRRRFRDHFRQHP